MSVETNLRTAMTEAVAPSHPDVDRLVSVARRQGLGIRRRRQVLGSVGVAAAVAVAVMAPSVVAGDRGTHVHPLTVGGSTAPTFDASRTSPATGRSTAAALLYAVSLETTGTATGFRGQGGSGDQPATYAVFGFTPAEGQPGGEVGINVQHFASRVTKPGDQLGDKIARCEDWMERCVATTLADGSKLTTYDDRSAYHQGRGVRRVASLYRPDGVRLVAAASNGYDITERDEQVTRDEPVLTTEQLVAVVGQAWWGLELPTYFATQDGSLKPYDEIGGATATATPSGPN